MAGENGGLISGGYNPLEAPDAPTSVSGSAGDASIDVSFTAPSDVGGAAIQTYIAVATASGETTAAEGESSPVTISGLTNGTAYSISAYAKNTYGYSPAGLGAGTVSPQAVYGFSFGGAPGNTAINTISVVSLSSAGNASDFGDLTQTRSSQASTASATRAVTGGGYDGSFNRINVIEYITVGTSGSSTDFGDLTQARNNLASSGSSTRALFAGGEN